MFEVSKPGLWNRFFLDAVPFRIRSGPFFFCGSVPDPVPDPVPVPDPLSLKLSLTNRIILQNLSLSLQTLLL